jgi:hypothetical protein
MLLLGVALWVVTFFVNRATQGKSRFIDVDALDRDEKANLGDRVRDRGDGKD